MNYRIIAAAVSFVSLAGCAETTEPETPKIEQDFVLAAEVLKTAQCELTRAAQRDERRFGYNEANLILTLKVTEVQTASGNVELAIPIGSGSLTLAGNRAPDDTAIRQIDMKAQHRVNTALRCPAVGVAQGLGIATWLSSMDSLYDGTIFPTEITQVITFKVGLNTDLSPKFTRTDADGGKRAIGAKVIGNRNLEQKLTVTIKPRDLRGRTVRVNRSLEEAASITAERLSAD